MKPWYPQEGGFASDPRYHQLLAAAGFEGLGALMALRGWACLAITTVVPDEQVGPELAHAGLVDPRKHRGLVEALLGVGYLARREGGYELLSFSPSARRRPGTGAPPVDPSGLSPEDRKRAKAAAKKQRQRARRGDAGDVSPSDVPPPCPPHVPPPVPRVSPGDNSACPPGDKMSCPPGDGAHVPGGTANMSPGDNEPPAPSPAPPDPPPTHAPTPAQAQAQAQAHEGRASAPAMGVSLGEEQENSKAQEPASPATAASPKAPKASKTAKPKAKAPKADRKALAAAHAAGVSAATGAPCAPTTDRWQLDALEAAASTHGAGQVGAALLGWLEGEARAFATAKAGDVFTASNGFAPKLFARWLDGGRPGAPRADVDALPPPRGGPIERGPRSTPTGPPPVIPEGASPVEIAAAGLFAPKTRSVEELEAAIRDEIDRQTPRPASPRRPSPVTRTPEQIAEARVRALAQLETARRQHEADHPEEAEAAQ